MEIISDKTEIQSGGNDFTLVHVKMLDQWGNPALDGQVGIDTSAGQLSRDGEVKTEASNAVAANKVNSGDAPAATGSQLVLQTEKGEAIARLIGSGAPGEAKLKAQTGEIEATAQVHIGSEMRPTILVGLAEMSFGKGIPEVSLRNETGNFRRRGTDLGSGRRPGGAGAGPDLRARHPRRRRLGSGGAARGGSGPDLTP